MRVYFVPYSLMKVSPTLWLVQTTKYQATTALVKSRDLHWSLMALTGSGNSTISHMHKDLINLVTLRAIVVADGANPWSLSSCDQFINSFKSLGLRSDVICPCAGSPETGTVALRRPSLLLSNLNNSDIIENCDNNFQQSNDNNREVASNTLPPRSGRGILSMLALSHSVVRVDQENSLTSLILQVIFFDKFY